MALNPYATLEDLEAYLGGEPPADCSRLLARAQDRIDAKLIGTVYDVDASGNPTDALVVIPALKQAVCAQVQWWLSTGDDIGELGQWDSLTVEGVSFQRGRLNAFRLAPDAFDVLRVAGLLASQTAIKIP